MVYSMKIKTAVAFVRQQNSKNDNNSKKGPYASLNTC